MRKVGLEPLSLAVETLEPPVDALVRSQPQDLEALREGRRPRFAYADAEDLVERPHAWLTAARGRRDGEADSKSDPTKIAKMNTNTPGFNGSVACRRTSHSMIVRAEKLIGLMASVLLVIVLENVCSFCDRKATGGCAWSMRALGH